jgi:hypothetical protein
VTMMISGGSVFQTPMRMIGRPSKSDITILACRGRGSYWRSDHSSSNYSVLSSFSIRL